MAKKIAINIVFTLIFFQTQAQQISPFGIFKSDSVKIGNELHYSLSVKYPLDWHIIFPDSTYDFSPFEYYDKQYFPTRVDSLYAYDSAVYTLSTFEIDLVQRLQLPIYLLNGKDSTEIFSQQDSVFLQEMITVMPDSLTLRENVNFKAVTYEFNYPYFMIGLLVLLILSIGTFLIFGKGIQSKIKQYRLRKSYEKFSLAFDRGVNKIRQNENNTEIIENILVVWKQYMEQLENRPFTKYTSKEIVSLGFESDLKSVLHTIDRALYGSIGDEQMHKNFEMLEDFTLERYQHKLKEVQNG